MPPIYEHHCDTCEFTMPSGWGGYMYVQAKICATCGELIHEIEDFCVGCGARTETVDTAGYERITCTHPLEHKEVERVLGANPSEEKRNNRTGFNSHCVCRDCLSQCELDVERDKRQCPDCESPRVRTLDELVDEPCPNCEEGTFIQGTNRGVA